MKGPKTSKKLVVTTISYPQELDDKVRAEAIKTHRSKSGMICEIISRFFKPVETDPLVGGQ